MKLVLLTTDNREILRDYGNSSPYFGTAPEALLQGLALLPEVEVHVVCCVRKPMKSPEKLAPNILYHPLLVPKIGWMSTLYQGCIRAVRRKLREIQPDIVHGQGTERDCAITAVFSGFPNVLTIHGNMRLIAEVTRARPFTFPWLAARLEGVTIPRSRGVVCITHYTEEAMKGIARQTWVVPNAVDASFFDVQSTPPPDRPPRILCVGVVCPRKNQNAFIRSLDTLAGKLPLEVLFLGHVKPGRGYDDEFLGLLKDRPWCRHGGVANRQQLKEHLAQASLLALPSLEDNCPMVVLEAMAAGVPVVAAAVGGVPDLVDEGKNGLLCDPLTPESISRAVERALCGSAPTGEMARRAKEDARGRFHPRVIAEKHLRIYEQLSGLRGV